MNKTIEINPDLFKIGGSSKTRKNREKITNYDDYLNSDSIKAINNFYEKD